ncbi:MAG: DEAD/DEAH box helicase [Eggerthella lenta]
MPTGAGKSVCYQVPGVVMDGLALVVSPLVSLMGDQVRALLDAGIRGAYLNSTLTPGQQSTVLRRALDGAYQIMYVAPERLVEVPRIRAEGGHPARCRGRGGTACPSGPGFPPVVRPSAISSRSCRTVPSWRRSRPATARVRADTCACSTCATPTRWSRFRPPEPVLRR